MEVVVPFGKGNKEINGYVTGFSERAEYAPEKMKEIFKDCRRKCSDREQTGCIGSLDERILWRNNDPGAEDGPSYQEKGTQKEKQKVRLLLTEVRRKRKAGAVPAQEPESECKTSGSTSGSAGTGL